MCLKIRIALAALASLALGAALVAYAADQNVQTAGGQPGENQSNAGQSGPVQASGGQPGENQSNAGGAVQPTGGQPGENQPGTTQPGAIQPGANQQILYQVNRVPLGKGQNAQNGQREDVDLFLIPCLIRANNGEVTLGNIAEQRGQSPEVKGFAREMIKDHTAGAKQLEQLQATLTQHLRPQNPNNTPVAAALFKINEEVEQNCLANAQRELDQESGSNFDRCYMGMQVGMHAQLVSALSVFKNHATSPDFRKAIDDLSQVASRHLEQAKRIEKDLMEHPQQAQQNQQTQQR